MSEIPSRSDGPGHRLRSLSSRLRPATPPRTSRASCCVKNERRCRFVRWVRFRLSAVGPTPRNPVRSVRGLSPPGVSKSSRRAKHGNNRPSRAEARARVHGPQFSAIGFEFPDGSASAPVSEFEALSTRSARNLLESRGSPVSATDAIAPPHVDFAKHRGRAAR
jgi:hypothetical protein